MKITLICIGKTDDKYLIEGIEKYVKRLRFYVTFNLIVIPDIKNSKNLSEIQQKEKEGESILKNIQTGDTVVLLDEKGTGFSSKGFSQFVQKNMLDSAKHLIFVIGGPYGFADALYHRMNYQISLSRMTFSHQMVRLFFVEQLYRAFTILKREPYHHE